ncbi:hypothetical protein DM02DRAFT_340732 [Periconia macrospinosa]|uniref:UbiA prenyltransferase n=1 Tax=Periconia macrospinosa TaxID=97972 RepID=A0A2V1DTG5_9PLEO|nr:hypothetical protein DM02DRAFT_340732 [Periconia macrospinosa]
MISSIHLSKATTGESKSKRLHKLHTATHNYSVPLPEFISQLSQALCATASTAFNFIQNLYLITIDDSPTFVVPNTVFGIAAASTPTLLLLPSAFQTAPILTLSWPYYLFTLLKTLTFNWMNLLIFDLANQRSAGAEDKLNKPWRPIPAGRMTESQMRHWLLAALPLVLAFNHYVLDTGVEGCVLAILTWMYNDLGGGDENWIIRNGVIAAAFGVYNLGSMKVAASTAAGLTISTTTITATTPSAPLISPLGYAWGALISGVILTTMHVQDLKDVEGDRARGRKSAPIVLGRTIASFTIAVPVLVWSVVCASLWVSSVPVAAGVVSLGGYVAWRCVACVGDRKVDRRTWQLWCFWTAVLYLLPPLSGVARVK